MYIYVCISLIENAYAPGLSVALALGYIWQALGLAVNPSTDKGKRYRDVRSLVTKFPTTASDDPVHHTRRLLLRSAERKRCRCLPSIL